MTNKPIRGDWDSFFMHQAIIYASRATCPRLSVGCVLVRDNLQLAEGYNGSISGHEHCDDEGCLKNKEGRCQRTIHAEQNALINAMKKGINVAESTAYVTHECCETCTKLLNQAGIKRIVYLKPYSNEFNKYFNRGMEVEELSQPSKEVLEGVYEEIVSQKRG